jgi:hypothetical protein
MTRWLGLGCVGERRRKEEEEKELAGRTNL